MKEFNYRHDFPIFQHTEIHYLDNASMSQTPMCVIDAVSRFDKTYRANVQRGSYKIAEMATSAYESARNQVAKFLNARDANEIVFTSGTTAAINIIAQSISKTLSPGDEIVLSQLEHHSNICPWQLATEGLGVKIKFIPATEDGRLDLTGLEKIITDRCRIIAITHGSNVTGAITDVEAVVSAARSVGAYVLLDGAQVAPHQKVDVQSLDVDFYSFSGHKIYGPTGIGVLWGRIGLLEKLQPVMGGGGAVLHVTEHGTEYSSPPHKFETGTPPIAQAIGLSEAIRWLETIDHQAAQKKLGTLTEDLILKLNSLPGVVVLGPHEMDKRLPVVSFHVKDIHPHDICHVLAARNVAVRGGHHCAQPLMKFFGVQGTTRVSLAPYNEERDIEALIEGLENVFAIFR